MPDFQSEAEKNAYVRGLAAACHAAFHVNGRASPQRAVQSYREAIQKLMTEAQASPVIQNPGG